MTMAIRRRDCLGAAAALSATAALGGLTACRPRDDTLVWEGGWVGASADRGHRLRDLKSGAWPEPSVQRRADVLIIGAGIAGLSAARALRAAGIDDVHLIDLEDTPGGNSRGHHIGAIACPLGAHYLPVPGEQAHEVGAWLHEIGVARAESGRTVHDERYLCHSPQERLFIDGTWHEGLLPPAEPGSATQAQYRRFGQAVREAQRDIGFAMPTMRAPWTAMHDVLDAQTFARWLADRGLDDPRLIGYLDYCCRDDYGASSAIVSAWAGLHYFASRHGFHAPGDEADDDTSADGVLTWPEGNAWLVQRLAGPLKDHLHTGRVAWRIDEGRHAVSIDAWDVAQNRAERWAAQQVVIALPLFIAARLLAAPLTALTATASRHRHAPWLVANIALDAPLNERIGAPPAWDNVIFGSAGLGYVNATHQSLRPDPGPTVLTAYWALPEAERGALLRDDWRPWAQAALAQLAPVHPDLPQRARRIDLMRYGHAMRIPAPGVRGDPALRALSQPQGRLHFAHADLSGYSVFEEAFTHGHRAGGQVSAALRR